MAKRQAPNLPSRPERPLAVGVSSRGFARPVAVNFIDHQIHLQNGTTTALEFTPPRLQNAKINTSLDPKTRIVEIQKEMGLLRQEVLFYRECYDILHRLRETAYDVYQQLLLECYFEQHQDQMHQLVAQLHHGLEDSVKREAKAEKAWKDFWGIPHNQEDLEGELI